MLHLKTDTVCWHLERTSDNKIYVCELDASLLTFRTVDFNFMYVKWIIYKSKITPIYSLIRGEGVSSNMGNIEFKSDDDSDEERNSPGKVRRAPRVPKPRNITVAKKYKRGMETVGMDK